jgi:dsDNA-binding SOS-regulon protein
MKKLVLVVVLAACSKPKDSPSASERAASTPATPAARSPAPESLTFADGTPEGDLRGFCMANYDKMLSCFDDPAFWDVLSTLFFSQNLQLDDGTNERREAWIGMRKDDLASLKRENKIREDCETAIRTTIWPTAAARTRVEEARKESCPSFGNAFGKMVFVDRAFHDRRPGL